MVDNCVDKYVHMWISRGQMWACEAIYNPRRLMSEWLVQVGYVVLCHD